MGVKIAIGITVYVLVAAGVSLYFWDDLSKGEPSVSATIRNLALFWGAPLATGLAVWRSIVAQRQSEAALQQSEAALKQAEVAQTGLLSNRYQRAVEMLGNDHASIRTGGVYALRNLAFEHPEEYQHEVLDLLEAFRLTSLPRGSGAAISREKPEERAAREAIEAILTE